MADTDIVLVRGSLTDGSVWRGVYDRLVDDGHRVRIAQTPSVTFEDDVEVTRLAMDGLDGPIVLVGHSYGGVVITEAGNAPNVVALVYVAAFVPDEGESLGVLLESCPPGAPVAPIVPARAGYLLLDRAKFHDAYTHDLDPRESAYLADAQVPAAARVAEATIERPAWKQKPSWYLVAKRDRMLPPEVQRRMAKRAGSTIVEVDAGHGVHIARPRAVAELIERAAEQCARAAA